MSSHIPVAIALGSNLGDRASHLAFASARLSTILDRVHTSSSFETEPVNVAGPQGPFLNAAITGVTTLPPEALLAQCLRIERDRGRLRPLSGAARTLDLDLILYGDLVIDVAGLTVPHPRFRERRFVLEPLAEIAPDWRDPVTTLTVADLLRRLPPAPSIPDQ